MSQHLISTLPSRSTCHRCGRPILSGIDSGMPYRVDLNPLNSAGELAARLRGLNTYRLEAGFVMYRGLADVRAPTTKPVLATHDCDSTNPVHTHPDHAEVMARYAIPHEVADGNALLSMTLDPLTDVDLNPPF